MVLASGADEIGHHAHQLLAHRILGAPALDRGDAVLGRHRLAVVPFQAVAQREGPGELVGRDLPLVDHLRLDLELVVEGKQRVVDHVAVMGGDQRRRPDRIDDLEVRMQRHLERGLRVGGRGEGQRSGKRTDDTTTRSSSMKSLLSPRTRSNNRAVSRPARRPTAPASPSISREAGHGRRRPRPRACRCGASPPRRRRSAARRARSWDRAPPARP